MTKTDSLIADLRSNLGGGSCRGVAGEKGLHVRAIAELQRLRRALEDVTSTLQQLCTILPKNMTPIKGAKKAVDAARGVLDAQ